jgi:hypothetical protein
MRIVPVEQAATLALKKIIPYSKMLALPSHHPRALI